MKVLRATFPLHSPHNPKDVSRGEPHKVLAALAGVCLGALPCLAQDPVKRTAKPKTPAKPRIVLTQPPRPPGIPTGEEVKAFERKKFLDLPYEGTRIKIHPHFKGDAETAAKFVQAYQQQREFNPPHRHAHFNWLTGSANIRLRGWNAAVISMKTHQGGRLVTVVVTPILDEMNSGKIAITTDYMTEEYFMMDNNVKYTKGIDPPDATRFLHVP